MASIPDGVRPARWGSPTEPLFLPGGTVCCPRERHQRVYSHLGVPDARAAGHATVQILQHCLCKLVLKLIRGTVLFMLHIVTLY